MGFLEVICLLYTMICWGIPVYLLFSRYVSVRIGKKDAQEMGGYSQTARPIATATKLPQQQQRPAQPPQQRPVQQPQARQEN